MDSKTCYWRSFRVALGPEIVPTLQLKDSSKSYALIFIDSSFILQESCRFTDTGNQIITSMGKAILNFHDETGLKQTLDVYENAHCPYRTNKSLSKQHHHRVNIFLP